MMAASKDLIFISVCLVRFHPCLEKPKQCKDGTDFSLKRQASVSQKRFGRTKGCLKKTLGIASRTGYID